MNLQEVDLGKLCELLSGGASPSTLIIDSITFGDLVNEVRRRFGVPVTDGQTFAAIVADARAKGVFDTPPVAPAAT